MKNKGKWNWDQKKQKYIKNNRNNFISLTNYGRRNQLQQYWRLGIKISLFKIKIQKIEIKSKRIKIKYIKIYNTSNSLKFNRLYLIVICPSLNKIQGNRQVPNLSHLLIRNKILLITIKIHNLWNQASLISKRL